MDNKSVQQVFTPIAHRGSGRSTATLIAALRCDSSQVVIFYPDNKQARHGLESFFDHIASMAYVPTRMRRASEDCITINDNDGSIMKSFTFVPFNPYSIQHFSMRKGVEFFFDHTISERGFKF